MNSFVPLDFIHQAQVQGEVVKCQDSDSGALTAMGGAPSQVRGCPVTSRSHPQGAALVAEEGQGPEGL